MSNFYFISDISHWFSIKFFFNLYNSSANLFFYDVKMHSSSIKLNICTDSEVQGTAAILKKVYFCFVSWTSLMILIPYINAWAISESSIQIVKENPIIANKSLLSLWNQGLTRICQMDFICYHLFLLLHAMTKIWFLTHKCNITKSKMTNEIKVFKKSLRRSDKRFIKRYTTSRV